MSLLPDRQYANLDLHKDWCQQVQYAGVNLSVWEEDFIESIDLQLQSGKALTDKQADILERIYTEKTS